jgi:hypothetical protein
MTLMRDRFGALKNHVQDCWYRTVSLRTYARLSPEEGPMFHTREVIGGKGAQEG